MNRQLLCAAVGVGVAAMLLSATVPPRTNRIYYDEHIYQGVAQNLSDLHLAQMCNDGTVEYERLQCWRSEFNKEPNGYPYLLSLLYRFTGVRERVAFLFNNLVAGLTALVVVLIGALLFQDARAAILGGVAIALLPMQLWWTNTAAAEPSAALFTAVAFLAVLHFARARTISALAWTVALAAFATTMRPESVLVVPLVVVVVLVLTPSELRQPRVWWAATVGGVLCVPSLMHLLAVRKDSWGTPAARIGWQYVQSNLPANFWFYLGSDDRFPVLVTVAALAGLLASRRRKETFVVGSYFLVFWGIFIVFYAGSYYYGADVRFALLSHVPLALLAGAGLGRLVDWGARWVPVRTVFATVMGATLLQFSWSASVVRAVGEEAWAARADVASARQFAARLPPNSIVLTHNPGVFHLWGINAAQLSLAQTDPEYVRSQLFDRYAGGVYLHWGFWCNVLDPVQTAFCASTLAAFPSELVGSARERDYKYRLYRLTKPPGVPAP